MTDKDILPEKDLLEKAAAIERFKYSPLGKELKKQSSVAEKQYQKLDNVFDKKEEEKTKNKRYRAKSNLVYNNYFTFYKYHNIKEFAKRFFNSKQNDLIEFKDKLELFYHDTIEIKPNNEDQIQDFQKRKVVLATASELYDKLLSIYKTQYD